MAPAGFEVFSQGGTGLDERLAAAWEQAGGAGLQIGMDTPQVTAELPSECLGSWRSRGARPRSGGRTTAAWWAIGLRRPTPPIFLGVPMSTGLTGAAEEHRLATWSRPGTASLPARCRLPGRCGYRPRA